MVDATTKKTEDYVIMGKQYSVRDFTKLAFRHGLRL